ncbi:unnamed protein product [Bursaphelenchus xylophilus]|uniref:(pine wood nematode) hypothetical protein n=1 Tax=Bursaphelenchus xylophilus TaxID=6326 RepID=A0A1I7SCV1_BURXY|nr:unnamed protein product [Bursaphelenchus xylophilus]CAG9093434.1 unnamed protein product [Bursaphelenchus xylophilus]
MIRLVICCLLTITSISSLPKQQRANCDINPNLPFCDNTEDNDMVAMNNDDSKDQRACHLLRKEYYMSCTGKTKKRDEFCAAYENICTREGLEEFGLNDDTSSKRTKKVKKRKTKRPAKKSTTATTEAPEDDRKASGKVDQSSSDTSKRSTRAPKATKSTKRPSSAVEAAKDYTDFCAEYKRRFLYVCPDPFRFGERAAIFCPVYSERCHVPLPDKPVVPTDPPPQTSEDIVAQGAQNPFAQQICAQYRGFATNYCQNPTAMQMPVVRDGCDKYRRYCTDQRQATQGFTGNFGPTTQGFSGNFGPWNRPVAQPQNFVAPWSTQFAVNQRPF